MPKTLTLFVSLLFLGITACGYDASQSSMPLVVDLPAVARALGRDELMTQQLEQARQQLNEQLVQIGANLEKQLKEKETELGKTSSGNEEGNRKQLDQLTLQAKIQLNKTRQLANQKAILYRDKLVSEFRNDVMKVAEDIASKRQVPAVYVAGNNLLWYASSIDITDEVIGVMRAQIKAVTGNTQSNNLDNIVPEQDKAIPGVSK